MNVTEKYRKACDDVARVFTEKYFKHERYGIDTDWAGGEVGGVYCVAGMYLNVDRMIEALETKATYEQLADFADLELECGMAYSEATKSIEESPAPPINFRNFVKYGLALVDKTGVAGSNLPPEQQEWILDIRRGSK